VDPLIPDYRGACLSRVGPELLGAREAPWLPEGVRDADAVVLLLLDGLGWIELREHADLMPTLSAMTGGPISTVVPATTASALTSLTTGLPPSQHGITGFRVLVEGAVLNVLRWHDGSRRPPDPTTVQRRAAWSGRPVPAVVRSEYRDGGFTRAHLSGSRFVGWHTPSALVEHARRLVAAGERFVFAYYPGIDTIAHEFGLRDAFYARELVAADRLVADLLDALPPRAALAVTSDHGQVHMEPEMWLELGDLLPLVEVQAGDGRFRSLYAREGARDELLAGLRERFGADAWILTRREVLEAGWLGPDPIRPVGARLGDVVLAARGPVAFVDPAVPFEARMLSAHGSPTEVEMLVPLVADRGRASA
jgi:hypothetical protein